MGLTSTTFTVLRPWMRRGSDSVVRKSLLRDSLPGPIIDRRALRTVLADFDYLVICRL